MSPEPSVSVIIPNRDRFAGVGRVLKALDHQSHRNFEVIIVSNQHEALAARFEEAHRAKLVPCSDANISKARNLGLAAAGGEIVAFIDDDAVPEPTWLERLIVPFENESVGAVGGLVRGRNGVSVQWGPQEVDCFGNDWALNLTRTPIKAPSTPERILKTVGTNCAFRTNALRGIKGFDQAYRYFLDETDVNWRLAKEGWQTQLVPDAEVHHGYARSAYRTTDRVPTSLKEIGASKAYFCSRFGDPAAVPEELDGFRRDQRARLIRAMELGLLEPSRVGSLLDSLEEGFVEGAGRPIELRAQASDPRSIKTFPRANCVKPGLLIATTLRSRRRAYARARAAAQHDQPVTLFDFSYSTLMMTVRFTDDGFWVHRGGIFGRTSREDRMISANSLRGRIRGELIRVAVQRKLKTVDGA